MRPIQDITHLFKNQFHIFDLGMLLRLARALSPTDFIHMLPGDVNMNFILPYLSECTEYDRSSKLKNDILTTYKAKIELTED